MDYYINHLGIRQPIKGDHTSKREACISVEKGLTGSYDMGGAVCWLHFIQALEKRHRCGVPLQSDEDPEGFKSTPQDKRPYFPFILDCHIDSVRFASNQREKTHF